MSNKNTINLPEEIGNYLWTRYLPETTYKMMALVSLLQENNVVGEKAIETLLNANIEQENNVPQIIEEKKQVLSKLGFRYPENREEDLDLLTKFKLVEEGKTDSGETVYKIANPIMKPQDVLNLDDDELQTIENIKFEIKNEQGLNMVLTLILNNNGSLNCSVGHIINTTRTKLTEVRDILNYLANVEKSINIIGNKSIVKLKKNDKIYINLNEDIFNKKRLIV